MRVWELFADYKLISLFLSLEAATDAEAPLRRVLLRTNLQLRSRVRVLRKEAYSYSYITISTYSYLYCVGNTASLLRDNVSRQLEVLVSIFRG